MRLKEFTGDQAARTTTHSPPRRALQHPRCTRATSRTPLRASAVPRGHHHKPPPQKTLPLPPGHATLPRRKHPSPRAPLPTRPTPGQRTATINIRASDISLQIPSCRLPNGLPSRRCCASTRRAGSGTWRAWCLPLGCLWRLGGICFRRWRVPGALLGMAHHDPLSK
jgi:hypothetical protein